jgi:hypothetical protein
MINHTNRISEFAGPMLAGTPMKSAERSTAQTVTRRTELSGLGYRRSLRRSTVALSIKACAILLSSTLFIGAAAAQTPYGAFANGQLQLTRAQFESTDNKNLVEWDRWNSRVAPEVARLYSKIMRAATKQSY